MAKRSIPEELFREISSRLREAHHTAARSYPGNSDARQPVHTVYGGAHLFRANTPQKLGETALRTLDEFGPNFAVFAKALALRGAQDLPDSSEEIDRLEKYIDSDPQTFRKESKDAWLALAVYRRVREKLSSEPVEDFRIDFEDGYGNRPGAEEDGHAQSVAAEVAQAAIAGTLPLFIGIRIKPFSEELRERSIRTLDIFLTELAGRAKSRFPRPFFITLPKVSLPDEAGALADLVERLERELNLPTDTLRLEVMVETPQAILNSHGDSELMAIISAARGRCSGAHFGTYDYTAARNITAAYQRMSHPACDFAREMMQVALAGTGVWLSDGATNILPIAPHRGAKGEAVLSAAQITENRAAVHHAWRLHFEDIRHSLISGFYQGWDLHPAQLPTRYAAVFAFFLDALDAASERLRNFVEKAAQATLVGEVFDDAATGQGLLNFFLRATNCGAIVPREVPSLTGLTIEELRLASFVKIVAARTKSS